MSRDPTVLKMEANIAEKTGKPVNAMVSHRVRLASKADMDAEVAAWLREAWDQAG